MIGYAPIGPLSLLKGLQAENALGDYHLVLAPEVINDPQGYKELFYRKGYFIILDNGSVENNVPQVTSLLYAASIIGATTICVPDYLRDLNGTLHVATEFLELIRRRPFGERPKSLMLIPQGRNYLEIISCARHLLQLFSGWCNEIYWGVPRWIANELDEGRGPIIEALNISDFQKACFIGVPYIHLLGMSNDLTDDMECTRMDNVMGIDSANPLVLGQLERNIWMHYEHLPRKTTDLNGTGKAWDFWQEQKVTEQTVYNVRELRRVINRN